MRRDSGKRRSTPRRCNNADIISQTHFRRERVGIAARAIEKSKKFESNRFDARLAGGLSN
jgi:hypothetical protein